MNPDMQRQLIEDLVIESLEGLDAFDAELMAVEAEQGDSQEHLRDAFRIMHTVKGSSGCLGFESIEKIAHAGENLLSLLRDDMMPVSKPVISGLLRCSDALRGLMHALEAGQLPEVSRHLELLQLFEALQASGRDESRSAAPAEVQPAWGLFTEAQETAAEAVPEIADGTDPGEPSTASASRLSDSAIRVEVAQIDRLMNLVGELVLARNQILQVAVDRSDPSLTGPVQRVNLITTELQASVMKTRMQTVQTAWTKFPRLVRDLSEELGKKLTLSMEGQDTELDRTVIEAIKDPLTHIVRNAIDHGLEPPEARRAAGKPSAGALRLRAFHEGGQVVLEISDDGRGIDPARIRAKALERGLITHEESLKMGDREAIQLVFQAGFSTAERITNVSGRGVGMDVVRANVERIGGTVDITSTVGRGTTIQIRIPLTLAIIPALLVSCAGTRFSIPQASLIELVRLDAANSARCVEWIDQAPVLRLRGKLLALVDLGGTLGLRKEPFPDDAFVVVVEAAGRKLGLVVDTVLDTEEIVVKPLHQALKPLGVYAGATILGDGRVALILDIAGLSRRGGMNSERKLLERESATEDEVTADGAEYLRLLMGRVAENRVAFPLEQVTRIEEIPATRIERSGPREVLQYRGRIMPLVRIGDCLGLQPAAASADEMLRVVVCQLRGQQSGLVIDEIEDIIEESVRLERFDDSRCLAGSLVAGGMVADLLDLDRVAEFAGLRRKTN